MAFSTRMHRSDVVKRQNANPFCHTSPRASSAKVCGAHLQRQVSVVARSSDTQADTVTPSSKNQDYDAADWVSVLAPEDLPKGVRKEVRVNGKSVLLFWYRNQIYAIDGRSPAEGAYSEGFIKAKFTQDYGIECPTTGSVFSLKDGSIVEWYPTNPVLRALTPKTKNMTIYPVKLTQDAIQIAFDSPGSGASTRGGADTSLENNNVFALQPQVYVAGTDDDSKTSEGGVDVSTAATFAVAISAFGIVGVAGTATCLYLEDYILLGGFWAGLLGLGAFATFQYYQNKGN